MGLSENELFEKAKAVKTAEEFMEFAKAEKLDISLENAKIRFEMLSRISDEIPDEKLEKVTGGYVNRKTYIETKCPKMRGVITVEMCFFCQYLDFRVQIGKSICIHPESTIKEDLSLYWNIGG